MATLLAPPSGSGRTGGGPGDPIGDLPGTGAPTDPRTGAVPLEDLPWRDDVPDVPPGSDSSITPSPTGTKKLKKAEGRLLTINAQGARWPVVYGRSKVGANIVYAAKISSYNWFVYEISIGPILDFGTITLGSRTLATISGGSYWTYLGDINNTLNTFLNLADGNWISARPQRAYVIVKLPAPSAANSNVDPLQFSCYPLGRECRDPRLGAITTMTGTTTVGVNTISSLVSAPVVGVKVTGNGIPPYTFVSSVSGSGPYTATVSNNATSSNVGATYTFDMPRLYTENPILHIADFMTAWFGCALPDSEIDWTTVSDAANICDQTIGTPVSTTGDTNNGSPILLHVVSLPQVSQKITGTGIPDNTFVDAIAGSAGNYTVTMSRNATATATGVSVTFGFVRYRMSLYIRDSGNGEDMLKAMEAHCMARHVNNSGVYQLFIDAAQSNCGLTFTDGSDGNACNIRDTAAKGVTMRSKPRSQIFSRVIVEFTDETKDYSDNSATAEDPGIAAGTVPDLPVTYRLAGCPTYEMARRLAVQYLNKAAKDKQIEIPIRGPLWQRPLPMNRCTLYAPGFAGVEILLSDVKGVGSSGLGGTVMAELYDAADYTDTIEAQSAPNPTSAPGPGDNQAVVSIAAQLQLPSATVPLGDNGSPPSNGDVLTFDSVSGTFKPAPASGGSVPTAHLSTTTPGPAVSTYSFSPSITTLSAVYVNGQLQSPADYSLSSGQVVFVSGVYTNFSTSTKVVAVFV